MTSNETTGFEKAFWPGEPPGLDELVRDICSVGPKVKSEFRDRIISLLASERSRIRKLVEGKKIKNLNAVEVWYFGGGYNQAIQDVLELLN